MALPKFGLGPILLLWACALTRGGELPRPEHSQWKAIADSVYLQETSRHLAVGRALSAVTIYGGRVVLGDAHGVWTLEGDELRKFPSGSPKAGPQEAVQRLRVLGEELWVLAGDGLWRLASQRWTHISELPLNDVCRHEGQTFAVGPGVFVLEGDGLKRLYQIPPVGRLTTFQRMISHLGTLYLHDGRHLVKFEGNGINFDDIADWGAIPRGTQLREMLSWNNRLYLATEHGLAVLRGMTWYFLQGDKGLPYEDATCLAPGFADDLWIGTTRGALRNVGQEYQYFGSPRWVPHDKVNGIACLDKTVYLATDGGLGIISYEPYTLAKKAAWYARWLEEWGQKRLGLIHVLLWRDGEWVRHISDNDLGYSIHRLASLCFQYAVTHDPAVRAEAVDMMKSVKWSCEITGIDGFPARAIWAAGEKADKEMRGSGDYAAQWHRTADGLWEWKGDTSSDELVAHVYGTMLFLELVAGPEERPWALEHLNGIIGHIVREGFVLRDMGGQPTRWGRWDPDYLLSPDGTNERGLNALEALSFLETAEHFTHDPKYSAAEKQLLDRGYGDFVLRQKVTFPADWFTPHDDRLAFLAYFPLFCYETNPALRLLWLRSLERSWEVKRVEGQPWFAFLYGVMTGLDCDSQRAVNFLREAPLDMRLYRYHNSHRSDLRQVPPGYQVYGERGRYFSPRETALLRLDDDYSLADYQGLRGERVPRRRQQWLAGGLLDGPLFRLHHATWRDRYRADQRS